MEAGETYHEDPNNPIEESSNGSLSPNITEEQNESADSLSKHGGDKVQLVNEQKATSEYQLGNCIGRGQFGAVYKGLNLDTGEVVAVKRIRIDEPRQGDVDSLMDEVELLKSLSHPNIVRYFGFQRQPDVLNIVLEFVENGSLLNSMKSFGNFPERLVANYASHILRGLQYLHTCGVAHCDLKAANVLTTKSGDVKLSDFGVSKQLTTKDKATEAVVGTPNWMAPEVIALSGPCFASDIWSLGCTVVELLTGKPPYADLINMAALFRIVEDDCPPLPPNISPELESFLKSCFIKEPDQRATAASLLEHQWILKHSRVVSMISPVAPTPTETTTPVSEAAPKKERKHHKKGLCDIL
ncbi:kinase-like protein [Gonapodya prolifera JEL478]|uniref:Kinase-like protein n=1 Tax=Gonapodya prolifera (strain JEL478) TaxID=1344416 RepID=A0A139AYT0_GONPJ|nr:kinase-like protein [Gonapodya prolifera JEL478]|eukprot:KXS21867.1 kinase-like protein [Gonapodya prolifera JEL478]